MKKTFTLLPLLAFVYCTQAQTFTDTLALDGNTQYAALTPGVLNKATVFTIEFWVKTTESRTNGTYWQRPTLTGLATANGNSGDFGITTDNGYISMWDGFSSTGNDVSFESPTVKINDNKWHHIAAVNNGTQIYLYVDGAVVDSLTSSYGIITANAPLTIGAASLDFTGQSGSSYGNTDFPSQGTFAEYRVSNNVRYTKNFTPATSFTTDANTVALYNFASQCGVKMNDASANDNGLTVNNGKISCSTLPFTKDLAFNGTSQSIRLPKSLLNGATTFTIETWFKSTDLGTSSTYYATPTIFGIENTGGNSGDFGLNTQGGFLQIWQDMYSGGSSDFITKAFVCDGQWHHIAAVANGTYANAYVDGVLEGTVNISIGLNTNTEALTFMQLNSQSLGSVAYESGEIDEIRLSTNARYTTGFTTPVAPFGTDGNTVALYHLDNCGNGTTPDASGNNNTADVLNITACGTLPPQYLQGKILFSHHNGTTTNSPDSIYTLDSTGKKLFITFGYRPRLSHDGRYLAFSNGPRPNDSYDANLWMRDLTTQVEQEIVSNSDYLDYYDFYPSDKRLVYSEECSIYTTNIDGTDSYQQINGYPDCFDDDPTIRVSDSVIAFQDIHYGLYTMGPNGSSPTLVPNTVPGDLNPSWSPDGQWLVYYKPIPGSYNGAADAYVPTNSVYKIKADGSDSTRLSFFSINDTLAPDPIWSKDMKSIYAIGRIQDTMGIFEITTDGSGRHSLLYMFDTLGAVADYWLGLSDSIKSSLLPVSLLNFTGTNLGKSVLLNWQTASEVNSSYFAVERSIDGRAFAQIGSVAAKGNSSSLTNYEFNDVSLPPASVRTLYYRLKQVDKDGNFVYSNVITITRLNPTALIVYPNPNKGVFNIVTKDINARAEVLITDASGRKVYHQVYQNTNAMLVNMPVAKGVYLVEIYDGKTTSHEKVVIE